MDDIRAQWAQLMGEFSQEHKERQEMTCHDPKVCRMFLCGICPHDLFENTKHYLGECSKIHCEKLRRLYLEQRKSRYYGYEADTLRHIQPLVAECDRRILKGKARAHDDGPERKVTDPAVIEEAKRMDTEIFKQISIADELGTRGDIEASYRALELAEALKKNKLEMLEKAGDVCYQQKLKPCDVCGALLSATDTDKRLTEHYSGKIHLGYQKLRDMSKVLQAHIEEHKHLIDPNEESQVKEQQRQPSDDKVNGNDPSKSSNRTSKRPRKRDGGCCLVLVGSTSFDELVARVDTLEIQTLLKRLGFKRIVYQIGCGLVVPKIDLLQLEIIKHGDTLKLIAEATLCICHCGAGTVLDVFEAKRRAIFITNDRVAQSHQEQLFRALHPKYRATLDTLHLKIPQAAQTSGPFYHLLLNPSEFKSLTM